MLAQLQATCGGIIPGASVPQLLACIKGNIMAKYGQRDTYRCQGNWNCHRHKQCIVGVILHKLTDAIVAYWKQLNALQVTVYAAASSMAW